MKKRGEVIGNKKRRAVILRKEGWPVGSHGKKSTST